jgi:hypothetical protein
LVLGASAVSISNASSGIYAKADGQIGTRPIIGSKIVVVKAELRSWSKVAEHPPAAVGLAQISKSWC